MTLPTLSLYDLIALRRLLDALAIGAASLVARLLLRYLRRP